MLRKTIEKFEDDGYAITRSGKELIGTYEDEKIIIKVLASEKSIGVSEIRGLMKRAEKEKAAGTPPPPKRDKVYVVQRNDTLIGIARRIYGDAAMYPRIYEANKDVLSSLNARLYVGMRLRMPDPE